MALVATCGITDLSNNLGEGTHAAAGRARCFNCIAGGHFCSCRSIDGVSPSPVCRTESRVDNEILLVLARYLSRDRRINDAELHAFDYFRRRTLLSLMKQSPTGGGWFRHAIQLSDAEPCVFQAIAAVASAHQSLIEVVHTSLSRPVATTPTQIALRHYYKAVVFLREYIDRVLSNRGSFEPVLLTCLLLMIFEILQGRHSNGAQHISFARMIVDEHFPGDTNRLGEATSTAVRTIRIASTGPPVTTSLLPSTTSPAEPAFPSTVSQMFSDLTTALGSLIDATRSICLDLRQIVGQTAPTISGPSLTDSARKTCLEHCLGRKIGHSQHPRLSSSIHHTLARLARWRETADEFLRTQQIEPSQALILLTIRHFAAFFTLATCNETEECESDRFENDFVYTLNLTEIYLRRREDARSLGPQRPWVDKSFHRATITEHGILPTLLIICAKCRTSVVRRRALNLLIQCRRIESEYSSGMLADFAQTVIDLEESQAQELIGQPIPSRGFYASEVPEQARFSDVVIAPVEGRSEMFRLVCARFAHERDGDVEITEHEALHEHSNRILLL